MPQTFNDWLAGLEADETLTPTQRNHRLVTHQIARTWCGPDKTTSTAERDMARNLGKAIIDADRTLADLPSFWSSYKEIQALVDAVRALQTVGEAAYEWHVGSPVPRRVRETVTR